MEKIHFLVLIPSRDGMVGVMLEGDSSEKERDDAGHVETVREEITDVRG
jgi:hypothetical protein